MLTQNGKVITIVDISNETTSKATERLREAQKEICAMTQKTFRLLTNASGKFDQEPLDAVVEFIKNTSFVTLHAVVCSNPVGSEIETRVPAISGRKIKCFDDQTKAIEWLGTQP